MPPKKKKSGKKKKKKEDGELTIEDKYKKTLDEIEALKDQLAIRKELSRRSQSSGEEWKTRMLAAEQDLLEHQSDQRAVSADMTRQYKTMQTEMGLEIHRLQNELGRTQARLEQTEAELKRTQEEKERLCREKDDQIADLQIKINTMGKQYEGCLDDAMDILREKLEKAAKVWEDKSTLIQAKNKQTLLEFGLNPLDL